MCTAGRDAFAAFRFMKHPDFQTSPANSQGPGPDWIRAAVATICAGAPPAGDSGARHQNGRQDPGPTSGRLMDCPFGLRSRRVRRFSSVLRIAASLACVAAPVAILAESVTVLPVADTYLSEQDPNSNFGNGLDMVMGTQGPTGGAPTNRGLLMFDISGQIPPGSQVTSVAVTLSVVKVPSLGANSTFELRRVLLPWNETEATWNHSGTNAAWSAPGGAAPTDFSSAPSGTQSVAGLGSYTFLSTANLVADVQSWVDNPNANFGWIVQTQLEDVAKTARRFASREGPANAPTLLIEYTPGQPQPLQMSQMRLVGDRGIFQL